MALTREAIYAALFTFGTGIVNFKTSGRLLKHIADVDYNDMPAFYQVQVRETPHANVSGIPQRWTLHAEWWIYVGIGADDTTPPSTLLNPLVDAIQAALKPKVQGDRVTLNVAGVYQVLPDGAVEHDNGFLGPKTYAIIPVAVTTAEL